MFYFFIDQPHLLFPIIFYQYGKYNLQQYGKKNTEEAPSVIEHEEFETLINYRNFNMAKNDVWNR